ncbi:SipW-dependent-type signal peptide-containing protein [Haloplanus aerogenes]|uniref:Putative ribosomally synthesized peptide with SipW-like signal peptide n=1 Tax=Haloplanus aerogenes TaxID=660522 RepID=A0A3M0DSC1_9EURY|nr:SipW-dependent-type signal peptide-containing protein [Haloplanus aerogenes]AZH25382.1 hypothetical protein DU502_08305 [Haloplanus aerogenes]RMB25085.1 putative ribosomally synthesized peptide with SipW-like signal peptide [Haloplanus aerogenes]
MTDDAYNLSRRKALAALGAIGAASAGTGLGTSAFFSDQETFENNRLVAGTLDMKVSWAEHYSDWSEDEAQYAHMEGGELVIDDLDGFMAATLQEQYPPGGLGPNEDPCDVLADVPEDLDLGGQPRPLIDIEDVKPGDFGEVTFDFALCDNPGYLWMNGELLENAENGLTEPEADDPDEGDVMNAGFGAGLAGLVGSLAASRLDTEPDADGDDGIVTRKNALRTATGAGFATLGVGAFAGSAAAAEGDVLGAADLPGHSVGVGIGFDGTYVYTLDGLQSSTLQVYTPTPGGSEASPVTATLVAEKNIVTGGGSPVFISTVDWDQGRERLWAADNGGGAHLIDVGDPTDGSEDAIAEFQFSAPSGLIDGLAYDGNGDTIWWSQDVQPTLYHFEADGTQIETITPTDQNGNPMGISGVATGVDVNGRPTLYVGNHTGAERIIRIYADDGTYISDFETPQGRIEDLACDPNTYDTTALLTMDAFDDTYFAFEIPEGSCLVGGVEEPQPPEEGIGELADALQVTIWYDDDCDNILDDTEEVVFEGSLADAMVQLGTGNGIPLAGDIDAAQGGGTGRNCYSATQRHCIGFRWDLPVDHANEIQSDSVRFDLGFYTEQCRHNDGSGMGVLNEEELEEEEEENGA